MGNIPQSLRDAIRANTVIPFVGAGVSMSIRDKKGNSVFPSWRELLEAAAERLVAESKDDDAMLVRINLKKGNYQKAADEAYEGLKGEVWNKFFSDQFDKDPDLFDSSSIALPSAIWKLGNKVITLNYDKVIEWGYGCGSSKVAILDNNSTAELADFQRKENDKPVVWHLHGKIDNRAELILTAEGYRRLYDSNNSSYRAALETLRILSVSHSFLFIGCSLDDAEILSEINRQQELFSGNSKKHYVFIRQSQENEIKTKLKDIDIQIITFEDFGDPLVRLIESLSEQKNDEEEPVTVESAKNEQSKILSVQPTGSKIALLSANPLDFPQSYPKLIKETKKINCAIDHYNLSIDNLNSLDGYTHIIIFSQITNNRILIEDDYFCSKKITLSELEANIDGASVQGIYVFTNSLPSKKATDDLILPFLFLSDAEKSDVDNLWFQLFKKNNLKFFKNLLMANENSFKHPVFSPNIKNKLEKLKDETPLPSNIDEKSIRNFVGRLDDMGTICRKLLALEDEGGFLTVKGSGGIGKTTIVKKLTIALAERGLFSGGITFVDCEFIVDYSQFQYKVADAFNLEQAEDVRQHLHDYFDDEKRLIILDNFETLLHINDSDKIKDFLRFVCDYASIIITSREVLQLENEGETVHVIRQLTHLFIHKSQADVR
jgi:hypothetical protein